MCNIPEIKTGDTLTVEATLVDWAGNPTLKKGQRVTVQKAIYRGGHFSKQKGCEDIWIERELMGIKLRRIYGIYSPETFKEFSPEPAKEEVEDV